jgi:predicted nucleic acid-binding protein
MTLVDTSVWVDHFRGGSDVLKRLLLDAEVVIHPFVMGELSLGDMRNRSLIMGLLANLPGVPVAEHREVMHLVETGGLAGSGVGWIDAHLIASALLSGARIMTKDEALRNAALQLGLIAT